MTTTPAAAPTGPDPAALAREWTRLDAGVPLMLLPVRLETRFVAGSLLIRIDPDVLHHDMHVDQLRSDEKALAAAFWSEVAAAGNDAAARSAAWQALAATLGPWRAAWVARALKSGASEGSDRGRPAVARLLPARWQARAWFAGRSVVLGWSNKVRAPLRLGFDIDDPHWQDTKALDADEQAGRLRLDPQARWLTDFDEAEACGMAIRVVLAGQPELRAHLDAGNAIDELVVVGVEPDLDAATAGAKVAALLDAHRYTRGLELVRQGTPTNNTEQVRTGVSPNKPDLDALLGRELRPWLPGGGAAQPVAPQTLAGRLARTLGLDRAGLAQRLDQGDVRQQDASAAMNRVLWPLTWGSLFGDLLAGADPARNRLVDAGTMGALRDWYCAQVRGGGNVATLRVGTQPYGLLPVRRLRRRGAPPTQGALEQHINDAVDLLRDTWREVLPRVAQLKPTGSTADAQATLLRVLSAQPHPWEFGVQRASDCRAVLADEYAGWNWAVSQHVPLFAALAPNLRFGEPGRKSLEFIHALFGAEQMPAANTADDFLALLACWAKLLCTSPTKDALPGILAAPTTAIAAQATRLEADWIATWKLDALRWQEALAGRPLRPIPRTIDDLIAYIDWLLGTGSWLEELLVPSGIWSAYVTGIYKRQVALQNAGVQEAATGPGAELKFCRAMMARVGAQSDESLPTMLRQARDTFVLHRDRIAPLVPLYARWGRSDRLVSHIAKDGPTGAFLAYDDSSVDFPAQAALVQDAGAAGGDLASSWLAELGRTDTGSAPRWDAARVNQFATAARGAAKPSALASFRAAGMSAQGVPPLLFQLGRAALAATSGAEQEAIRRQLALLAAYGADELDLRLREALGPATHRLDAWATGLASQALDKQRDARPAGLQIGAYGWVENLRRDEKVRDSLGHLLAPSLAHAASAAVLRAGWQAFGGDGPRPDPGLAVRLDSAQVRTARALLDGLRAGETLGDLLGQRFERGLHDGSLDAWIDKLRVRVAAATGQGDARQPIDGLALWNLWSAGDAELKAMVSGEPKLRAPLEALGTQLDALLDLGSAEGVYQLVQGNMPRMAAALDALGQPDVDPPPCQFPSTPRPGRTITHRLLLSLPDKPPAAGDGWATTPRAAAAPALEGWARLALGPATRWRIVSRWVDAAGTAGRPNAPVEVSRLGLGALDALFLGGDDAAGVGAGWTARLLGFVAPPAAAGARLELLPDSRDGLLATDLTAATLFGLARQLRQLLADAVPADARHLGAPGDAPAPGTDLDAAEFTARAGAAAQQLAALLKRLDGLLARPADGASADPDAALAAWLASPATAAIDTAAVRAAMLEATGFGVGGAACCGLAKPGDTNYADDRQQLLRLAVATSRGLALRSARAAQAAAAMGTGRPADRIAAARQVFDAVFGRELPVPAVFRVAPEVAAELEASFAASGTRPGEGPGARLHWLTQVAKVQPRAARLADALLQRAATSPGAGIDLVTAQLPHRLAGSAPEPWAATGAPSGDREPRVCLLACGARPKPVAAGTPLPLQALLVDQWSEVIPDGRQTAAVAFHFDAPAARAPQAVLLAVPPEGATGWTCDDVVETVRETLEWARLRAVGPAELAQAKQAFGQFLPAVFSPVPFELPGTLLAGQAGLTHRWRLEGRTTTENLEPGTQARIADPLWMLSRQWQVGEFQGEDAAMPVAARVEIETSPITSLRNEPGGTVGARPVALSGADSAEVLAEAQDAQAGAAQYALCAEAGLRFMAMLGEAGIGTLGATVRAAFPLARVAEASLGELGPAERRRIDELAAIAPDASALATALRADATLAAKLPAATPAQRTQLAAVAAAWLAQPDAGVPPAAGGSGWSGARLEYGLSLAAATADGEVVLRASDYPGGRLDWEAFDISPRAPHGLAAAAASSRVYTRIPSPLRYAGMPADRWWEFEDGEVDFGGVQATPADLQRMMVAGYAVGYSDDWHVVPITLPSGRLARVRSMHVDDSFGQRRPIASIAALDHQADASRPWRLFELSGDPGPAAGRAPWLLLAPALPDAIDGPTLEEVQFVRDDTTNLVWAIERRVEGPLGDAIDRVLAWKTRRGVPPASLPPLADGQWRYQVAPPTPAYMVPLLPERGADAQVRLRRGRIHQGVDAQGRPLTTGAVGRVLNPAGPTTALRLFEDEIPAAGVQVRRCWQLARDRDGRVWLWLGQRKTPGRGDKEPGAMFDRLSRA